MSAALGLAQLEKLDFMIDQRIKIADLYNRCLSNYAEIIEVPKVTKGDVHTWFVYVIRVKNPKIKRDKIIRELAASGISTKPYLPSIHLFDFYKKRFKHKKGDFPVSETISDSSLALPFYIGLKENDIKNISNKVISVLSNYGK